MRIVLVGAVESSAMALRTMVNMGYPPIALLTLPLDKSSRHSDFVNLRPAAAAAGIPVIEAADGNSPETLATLRALRPDLVLVIGWSQLCKKEFLAIPKSGCLGYHPALIPENRGRAVIVWTILQGVERSGGTLFWLGDGADTGDVFMQRPVMIATDETARTLMDKHTLLIEQMLREALPLLNFGECPRITQDHAQATYCARRTAEDGSIDWKLSAREIWTLIRATGHPYPGAFTDYAQKRMVVWSADLVAAGQFWGLPGQVQRLGPEGALVQCGDRAHVLLKQVQFDGQDEQSAFEAKFKIHSKLGVPQLRS